MILFHLIILSLIQGITEFLPVSSSGHLALAHAAMGHDNIAENRLIDIAVHVGTLAAVLLYFWRDIVMMIASLLTWSAKTTEERTLALCLIVASLPVIAAGFALHYYEPSWLGAIELVAWNTLIFGIVLWVADRRSQEKHLESLSFTRAFAIGLTQVLALLPGVSRSGITMTAARGLGLSRTAAAKFSLLLGIVAISGAGVLGGKDLLESDNVLLTQDAVIAAGLSFISALAAIAVMMAWLRRASFTPFVIYRIVLGLILLASIYLSPLLEGGG